MRVCVLAAVAILALATARHVERSPHHLSSAPRHLEEGGADGELFSFLKKAKEAEPKWIVIGNQAGDLDSIVSAISLAYILTVRDGQHTVVPVMPFPRADFRLRGDAVYLFEKAGFDLDSHKTPKDLVFLDEVAQDKVRGVALVDHNALAPALKAQWDPLVTLIVDHHTDENQYPEAERHIHGNAGSCSSIVAKHVLDHAVPSELALILLGPLVLDTANFDLTANRAGPLDEKARNGLLEMFPKILADWENLDGFFEKMTEARSNVLHLPMADLLRLDYKGAKGPSDTVGISAILATWQALKVVHDEDAIRKAVHEYAKKHDLRAVVLLTNPDGDARHVVVVAKDGDTESEEDAKKLGNYLKDEIPGSLTDELKNSAIFAKQGVAEKGFSMEEVFSKKGLTLYSISPIVTRKTLKPSVELFLQTEKDRAEAEEEDTKPKETKPKETKPKETKAKKHTKKKPEEEEEVVEEQDVVEGQDEEQ